MRGCLEYVGLSGKLVEDWICYWEAVCSFSKNSFLRDGISHQMKNPSTLLPLFGFLATCMQAQEFTGAVWMAEGRFVTTPFLWLHFCSASYGILSTAMATDCDVSNPGSGVHTTLVWTAGFLGSGQYGP